MLAETQKPDKKQANITQKEKARLEKERLLQLKREKEARQAAQDEKYELPFYNPKSKKHIKELDTFFDAYYKQWTRLKGKERASTTVASDTLSSKLDKSKSAVPLKKLKTHSNLLRKSH